MDDVRAVDWLPLDDAVERLSRGYERAFLANVGPLALKSAAVARRPKARKQPVAEEASASACVRSPATAGGTGAGGAGARFDARRDRSG